MLEYLHLFPQLAAGATTTLLITLLCAPSALIIALLVGIARLSSFRVLAGAAKLYVEVFRGTSLIVQLFYLYYVLPLYSITLSAMATGIAALSLNVGAYGAEVARAALQSVPVGQYEACFALNMPRALALRRIILPQAILIMLPTFGNLLIEMLKATSVLSLITIGELTFAGTVLFQTTGQTVQIYATVLCIYFAMAMILTVGMRRLEKWLGAWREPGLPA
jgi:polar amino acid transport system permease protein